MKQTLNATLRIFVWVAIIFIGISSCDNSSSVAKNTAKNFKYHKITYYTPFFKYTISKDTLYVEEMAILDSLLLLRQVPSDHIVVYDDEWKSHIKILSNAECHTIDILNKNIKDIIISSETLINPTYLDETPEQLVIDGRIVYYSYGAGFYVNSLNGLYTAQTQPIKNLLQYIVGLANRDLIKLIKTTERLKVFPKLIIVDAPNI